MNHDSNVASRLALWGIALLGAAALAGPAHAQSRVSRAPNAAALTVDVWTNKEEGGVYRPGEGMRIFFRPSEDAFVLLYNVDTDGFVHLIYPYGPNDPERVEGAAPIRFPPVAIPTIS